MKRWCWAKDRASYGTFVPFAQTLTKLHLVLSRVQPSNSVRTPSRVATAVHEGYPGLPLALGCLTSRLATLSIRNRLPTPRVSVKKKDLRVWRITSEGVDLSEKTKRGDTTILMGLPPRGCLFGRWSPWGCFLLPIWKVSSLLALGGRDAAVHRTRKTRVNSIPRRTINLFSGAPIAGLYLTPFFSRTWFSHPVPSLQY